MTYSNFTLDTAVEAFDLEEMNAAGIFAASEPVQPSDLLTAVTPRPVWNPDIQQPIKETPQQKHPLIKRKRGDMKITPLPPLSGGKKRGYHNLLGCVCRNGRGNLAPTNPKFPSRVGFPSIPACLRRVRRE